MLTTSPKRKSPLITGGFNRECFCSNSANVHFVIGELGCSRYSDGRQSGIPFGSRGLPFLSALATVSCSSPSSSGGLFRWFQGHISETISRSLKRWPLWSRAARLPATVRHGVVPGDQGRAPGPASTATPPTPGSRPGSGGAATPWGGSGGCGGRPTAGRGSRCRWPTWATGRPPPASAASR